ncbi:MAG: hypothetical protein FD124_1030 [Alphaproteobacteria bacterium]|nr:MAG: hypothetical protein FD160_1011 [Caulobacteraceae bacterium]TPW07583.1 MAG: hypothetical protein FD124_1030 [Alphaproteobacteria bacterium]
MNTISRRSAASNAWGSALAGLALFTGSAAAQTAPDPAPPPLDMPTAIQNGAPIFEIRSRYETVSQSGVNDAEALSVRTRLGWQTAKWENLVGLIEFEDVRQLGGAHYNDGVPPAEPYAAITDPDVTELNRLQLTWTPTEKITATIGRQRINLDDQRFVGAVAWRQDEQTFDAVKFDFDLGRLDVTYAYLGRVNRIFAEDLDWETDTHLLNASYTVADPLKITTFAYAMDFTKPAAAATANLSNFTYGARVTGNTWAGRFKLNYAATYATQSDYGSSLVSYDADYLAAEASVTLGPTTARLAYESLEGEGANRRFITPLATLHAFQGWSDAFIANGAKTPNDGIDDLNASIVINPRWRKDHLFNINLVARYHDFEAQRTGADLGDEINLSASAQITRRLGWIVKWADYDGPGGAAPADRTKTWVGLEFRL